MKNIDEIFEEENKKVETYNKELSKRSKRKQDLVASIDCLVESVTGYVSSTSFHVQSEIVYGGKSPSYSGGDSSHLEIFVKTNTAVKKLLCKGLLPIQKGDTIKAYILLGKEEFERDTITCGCVYIHSPRRSYWVERELNKEENPFKIEKLVNNEVVATYLI